MVSTNLIVERIPAARRHVCDDPSALASILSSLQFLNCKRQNAVWVWPEGGNEVLTNALMLPHKADREKAYC